MFPSHDRQSQSLEALASIPIRDASEVESVLLQSGGDEDFAAEIAETEAAELATEGGK